MRFSRHALLSAAIVIAASACSTSPSTKSAPAAAQPMPPMAAGTSTAKSAKAVLAPASGSLVSGTLMLMPMAGGVHIMGELGGLTGGKTNAIHVHEKGDCSAADATSAGGHFNPASSAHGRAGTPVHHAGDMDNLVVGSNGVAKVDIHLDGVTLGGGAANDIANRAIVVHAAPDDYTSQPAGNAGARVACGVIKTTP